MANNTDILGTSKKRKRVDIPGSVKVKPRKSRKSTDDTADDGDVLALEGEIVASPKSSGPHIDRLIKLCASQQNDAVMAGVALCRAFCKLMIAGAMSKSDRENPEQEQTRRRMRVQYNAFVASLGKWLVTEDVTKQSTGLTLLMRLVKQETTEEVRRAEQVWTTGAFFQLMEVLVSGSASEDVLGEFTETYLEAYDDVRYFTFKVVSKLFMTAQEQSSLSDSYLDGCITLLLGIQHVPGPNEQLERFYGQPPVGKKHALTSLNAHRKAAEEAWGAIFRSALSKSQHRVILGAMTDSIVPWYSQPERLMDVLTDAYDEGGATSLLALSGLFHLMQEKNLDYPQFFPKLYSLLDEDILHSKHRSKFIRLLDQFMASTHLPASLVASFIKRLARLALHAPPAGIIAVIPWIYNMLKRHPTCTFMIHREVREPARREEIETHGMEDCFDMQEVDPTKTGAIDSCLWEIETLQGHYYPNVATLAKIISEQFTKRSYNLEDFLDHTYQGLVDAELAKDIKKTPVTEFEIPKRIFTTENGGLDRLGGLVEAAMNIQAVAA